MVTAPFDERPARVRAGAGQKGGFMSSMPSSQSNPFSGRLILSGRTPLARGKHRVLYCLDEYPGLIVKVMPARKPPPADTIERRIRYALYKRFPVFRYRFWIHEQKALLRLRFKQLDTSADPPVASSFGIVLTDLGMGMLGEKIQTPDGELAPSLEQLVQENRVEEWLPHLNEFVAELYRWEIRAHDLKAANIVLGFRQDRHQFILVDGLGDGTLIPLRSWSARLNVQSLNKRLNAIAVKMNMGWNQRERRFFL